jgi:hypothetical protein
MNHAVTVLVSPELVEALGEWSPTVQVRIIRTPGVDPEYTMEARRILEAVDAA